MQQGCFHALVWPFGTTLAALCPVASTPSCCPAQELQSLWISSPGRVDCIWDCGGDLQKGTSFELSGAAERRHHNKPRWSANQRWNIPEVGYLLQRSRGGRFREAAAHLRLLLPLLPAVLLHRRVGGWQVPPCKTGRWWHCAIACSRRRCLCSVVGCRRRANR